MLKQRPEIAAFEHLTLTLNNQKAATSELDPQILILKWLLDLFNEPVTN